MKALMKTSTGRIIIAGSLIVLQVIWFVVFVRKLTAYSLVINLSLKTLSLVMVLRVMGTEMNPASKLAWVIPLLTFPILGGLMCLLLYQRKPTKKLQRKLTYSESRLRPLLPDCQKIMQEIRIQSKPVEGQVHYLLETSGFPIYKDTQTFYYPSGEETLPVLLAELEKAEYFIFMEYFIIRFGTMWGQVLEILKRKAAAGVDVRVIYDDVGSLTYLPHGYYKELEAMGIRCEAFNHFVPFFSAVMNNRDHRKITVIDGHTGFSGGINLGDEYINKESRYGYWKDNGIMLKGEAVWSLTVMFLTMWNAIRPTDRHFEPFTAHAHHPGTFAGTGYVQPYSDSPLDNENVGENVYINMINSAQDYITMINPYIVLDNELITAMTLAAKRGVDIKLIVPGISDSKIVSWLADTYFPQLMEHGVKIYQYKPGFLHSKVFLCDDKVATVGSFNLDYRSLYLHFECGIFLYQAESVQAVRKDRDEILRESRVLTLEMLHRRAPVRVLQQVLRIFAPLI